MSRIGKVPVTVPKEVTVDMDGGTIRVKGPRGELSRELPSQVAVELGEGRIVVSRSSEAKLQRSLHGLTRTLVQNMVDGVTKGFTKQLDITGVGYRASKGGGKLLLTLGFSHPVEIQPPDGILVEVPSPTTILIKGNDKEMVGQMAAKIRGLRPPEPYKGKGIRYAQEVVRRKAGKTGKK